MKHEHRRWQFEAVDPLSEITHIESTQQEECRLQARREDETENCDNDQGAYA